MLTRDAYYVFWMPFDLRLKAFLQVRKETGITCNDLLQNIPLFRLEDICKN